MPSNTNFSNNIATQLSFHEKMRFDMYSLVCEQTEKSQYSPR